MCVYMCIYNLVAYHLHIVHTYNKYTNEIQFVFEYLINT